MPLYNQILNSGFARKAGQIALTPWFLAAVMALLVFLVVPHPDKYKLSVDRKWPNDNMLYFYDDLEGDQISELIIANNDLAFHSCFISFSRNSSGNNYQWNFRGRLDFINNEFLTTGDFDSNGSKEIYLITISNDSLYLNCLDYQNDGFIRFKNRFVDTTNSNEGKKDIIIFFGQPDDLNKDGFKELIFVVNAGYSCQPRNVYALDIHNDKLLKSPPNDYTYLKIIQADIDNDDNNEIILGGYASNNSGNDCDPVSEYTDNNSWFMVLDTALRYKFDPVLFPGIHSSIRPFVLSDIKDTTAGARIGQFVNEISRESLVLFDDFGDSVKQVYVENDIERDYSDEITLKRGSETHLFLSGPDGKILEYDTGLELVKSHFIGYVIDYFREVDIDRDGEDEIIMVSFVESVLLVFRNNFKNPASIPINAKDSRKLLLTIKQNGKLPSHLCVTTGEEHLLLSYGKNPVYLLRWGILAGTYLIFLLFGLLVRRIQINQIHKRLETEKQVSELQLKLARNQLDPHFSLNAINTVIYSVQNNDPEKATEFLYAFARLFKSILLSAEQYEVTLKEELEFIGIYLKMEQLRFPGKFTWSVTLDEAVNSDIPVPKMVIQTAVENAVKHGIAPLEKEGRIEISISDQNKFLAITVTDNGIGRGGARNNPVTSTGKGQKITRQFLEKYAKLTGRSATMEFEDLYNDDHSPAGSRVIFNIQHN